MKTFNLVCLSVAAASLVALAPPALAADDSSDINSGLGLSLGYKSFNLKNTSFSHNTHPDDSFLPNANVPGSAGTTSIDGTSHYLAFGVAYQSFFSREKAPKLTWNLGFDGLYGGRKDDRQNANDMRPAANGAFVYTDSNWGMCGTLGGAYHFGKLYVGVDGQIAGIFVDSGWDRYNSYQSEHSKLRWYSSAGPKVGFQLWKGAQIEGGVQFGSSTTYTAAIKLFRN